MDNCWEKRTFGKFDVFQTPLEAGCLITSETNNPLLTGIYCTCCTYCDCVIVFLIFQMLISAYDLEFLWDIPQDMELTKYPWGQYSMVHLFVNLVAQDLSNLEVLCHPSWMKLWKIHYLTPHEIEVIHDQLLGLGQDLMIFHEMVIVQDISMHVIRVPT